MADKDTGRTVKPDGQRINRLRSEKGWNVAEMAANVGCSKRTVEKLESGSACYLFTLSNFAKALGVECRELLKDATPLAAAPTKERRFEVQIKLSIPYEE